MEEVICINIAVFINALTRGKTYEVLANDLEKMQIKIKGDNGRVRWYPQGCFSSDKEHVLTVKSITIDDKIRSAFCDAIEVTLVVAQGNDESRRWCYFLTPAYVYKMFGNNTNEPVLVGRHGIFLPVLSEDEIKKAIDYLLAHNELEDCSLPLGEESSEE